MKMARRRGILGRAKHSCLVSRAIPVPKYTAPLYRLDSIMETLEVFLVWAAYLIPTFCVLYCYYFGWEERRQWLEARGRGDSWPYWKGRSLKAAIYVNVFLGWTVLGWFYALRFAWFAPERLEPFPGPRTSSPPPSGVPP